VRKSHDFDSFPFSYKPARLVSLFIQMG